MTSVMIGGTVVVLVVAPALLAPLVAPFDPDQIGAGRRLSPPSAAHLLGTDEFGRDILSRILFGAQFTLYIGFVAVGIGLACGVVIGAVAAYAGGWLGGLLMRAVDLLYTFPDVLIALGLVAFLGPNLTNAMVAVGISAVPYYARVTFGVVLAERQKPYVASAQVVGAGHARVIVRHLLPNVLPPMIVVASLGFSAFRREHARPAWKNRRMTEFTLRFGPHRLAGYRTGSGTPLLLVHGRPGVPCGYV